jgi:methyl-accepting chemotaxis protein
MNFDLSELQEFLVSQEFVWSYIAVIVVYFIGWCGALVRRRLQIGNAIRAGTKNVTVTSDREAFARRFHELEPVLRRNAVLGRTWAEFTECLILPTGPDAPVAIRNTRDPDNYFSASAVIEATLNVRFYGSIPGHLTGLGILGTFLGLAAGIGLAQAGLATGDTQQVQDALQDLLSGASLAFLTSIAGLTTSILFLVFERWQLASLERRRVAWVQSLDERLLRVTQETIAVDQLVELREQTTALKRFNDDLAISIAEALDEKLAARLSPQIDDLRQTLHGMRSDQGEASERLITSVVERFEQSMTGGAGREMDALRGTLEQLNLAVRGSADSLQQQQDRMSASLAEMVAAVQGTMGASSERMKDEIGATIDRLAKATEESAAAMREASHAASSSARDAVSSATEAMSERLATTLDALASRMDESSTKAAGQLTAAGATVAQRLGDTSGELAGRLIALQEGFNRSLAIGRQLEDVADKVTAASEGLANAAEQLAYVMPSLKETSLGIRTASTEIRGAAEVVARSSQGMAEAGNQIRVAQDRVVSSWEDYAQRFDGTDRQLALVFQQIDEGLDRYTVRIREFTREVDASLAKAVETLSGVVGELGETLEDLSERLPVP